MTGENISSIATALVVGGGIGGMATAISLARRGVAVDLIDLDPDWRVYGAGITITGPTLRAYKRLGLLDAIKRSPARPACSGSTARTCSMLMISLSKKVCLQRVA